MKKVFMFMVFVAMAFATGCDKKGDRIDDNGDSDSHGYIDMGLPSGTLWATCNVGAENPVECGYYFAWGETEEGRNTWNSYKYANGSWNKLTKYCSVSEFGDNGFTDTLTVLLPEDDAVTVNWGDGWRTPTRAEFEELQNNCTVTWTYDYGVYGYRFTASNGNILFFPAVGCRWNWFLRSVDPHGCYWSSSLSNNDPSGVWALNFCSSECSVDCNDFRCCGFTVRPVRSAPKK